YFAESSHAYDLRRNPLRRCYLYVEFLESLPKRERNQEKEWNEHYYFDPEYRIVSPVKPCEIKQKAAERQIDRRHGRHKAEKWQQPGEIPCKMWGQQNCEGASYDEAVGNVLRIVGCLLS